MSQEMNFEEVRREDAGHTFEEGRRTEEIPGYRGYTSETNGQKLHEMSINKIASSSQRLFLAVVSLGMLLFASLVSMFLMARMSLAAPTGGMPPVVEIDGPGRGEGWIGYGPEHGHHWVSVVNQTVTGNVNELFPLLIISALVLFFVATIAINIIFNRVQK